MDSKAYSDDDQELSDSDDEGFGEDMEALRRACILTGTDPKDLQPSSPAPAGDVVSGGGATSESDEEDDLELVRGIQQRFAACTNGETPLFLKPLKTLPPAGADSEDEDDFETLRAIQRRFSGYDQDGLKNSTEICLNKMDQIHVTNTALDKEASNHLVVDKIKVSKGNPDSLNVYSASQNSESFRDIPKISPPDLIEWHQPDAHNLATTSSTSSGYPKSAQMFVDAIKKNRTCQKFLRSKLIQIEARIEENKKLMQRVKILKDFQVTCKKQTGRALSQKKDARVQLISATKLRANSQVNGKKISALYYGPDENSHVASYRMVLTKFPISLRRPKWSDEERENLAKGIKQQFQELLLQKSVDLISDVEGPSGDSNLDSIVASIRDVDITPENIRSFLPKVNWERLASMYVAGHSGAECEARWLNCEDPLINHHSWSKTEDKKLMHVVQERGINNWIDIAILLGTNRTPFQCLARYQRSLNASILKREWTEEEDDKLRAAVEAFGESNWQPVASTLEGRTGTQCSNRWIKSLHPSRQRVGKWTPDEDKRLKVAVMIFGPKTWRKVAQLVPGRTHVQCRERWFNCLDPSLIRGGWTEEEDSRLEAAITEHEYCWSKIAKCVPPRTDNQCKRRWMQLHPEEVPLLKAAKKIQKIALISNFVDRESQRPALGANDFIPLALMNTVSESDNINTSRKKRRKSRRRSGSMENGETSRFEGPIMEPPICSEEVLLLTNGNEVNDGGSDAIAKKKRAMKLRSRKKKSSETNEDMVRIGEEIRPFDWITKKKRTFGRQKNKFQGRPEAEEIHTASKDNAISSKKSTMKPRSKKKGSTDLTKSHLSGGDLELLNITNGDEVGEHGGDSAAKNKKSSKRGRKKIKCIESLDKISGWIESDEVVRCGGNDASGKSKKLYLSHLKQDKHTDPTQVHSSVCPDSTSLRIANVNEVEASGVDAARKKNYLKPSSLGSKSSRLPMQLSERTDFSEVETLGSKDAILKKKSVAKRRLKKCPGLNHSSTSQSFAKTDKEVNAFGETEATKKRRNSKPCSDPCKHNNSLTLLPAGLEIRAANDGIETVVGDDTILHGKKRAYIVYTRRKGSKQSGEQQNTSCIEVAKLQSKQGVATKLLEGSQCTPLPQNCSMYVLSDNGNSTASGICVQERLKRSRDEIFSNHILGAEDGDDMTLAYFILKMKQKKRRLKLSEKSNDASCSGSMDASVLLYKEECYNNVGRNDVLSSQAMQSSHLEDLPGVVTGEIDFGKSHLVFGETSFHESLEEPLSIDPGGVRDGSDDLSDECSSPPPGFENPIYRSVAL